MTTKLNLNLSGVFLTTLIRGGCALLLYYWGHPLLALIIMIVTEAWQRFWTNLYQKLMLEICKLAVARQIEIEQYRHELARTNADLADQDRQLDIAWRLLLTVINRNQEAQVKVETVVCLPSK